MEKYISPSFDIIIPHIDESLSFKAFNDVRDIVKDISLRKCLEVAKSHENDIVIAADTVVVIDNEIIGKPKNKEDAYNILNKLSNREHYVYTGYAIKQNDKLIQGLVRSEVLFNKLNDKFINDYIASGSPMDKAGAYGLQDNESFAIVKSTTGSMSNIIGFPVDEIKEDLKKHFNY